MALPPSETGDSTFFSVRSSEPTLIVELRTATLGSSSEAVLREFTALLGRGARAVAVNLASVKRIQEPEGLLLLAAFRRTANEKSRKLVLFGAVPSVEGRFRMRLHALIELRETEAEALAALTEQ